MLVNVHIPTWDATSACDVLKLQLYNSPACYSSPTHTMRLTLMTCVGAAARVKRQ